jgi:alginate O-acetyltransferase complex protein AlgI
VSFADGAFPVFLWAAVMLCALLRRGAHGRVATVLGALAAALLVDLTWLVALRPHTPLASPWGVAIQRFAGPLVAPPSLLRVLVGSALFVAAMLVARRAALRADEPTQVARARALGVATLLGVAAFVVAAVTHRLDDLARILATAAHPLWLALWGFAWGAATTIDGRRGAQQLGLFLLSALFYQSWAATMPGAYRFLFGLIVATVVLDYWLARLIDARADAGARRAMLVASLVANLGILGVFKYADFVGENLFTLARLLGRPATWNPWHLVLPAGISFHTFQSLSYTVDVYRRRLRPTASLLEFATFVLFFPQLVAGPIVRADEFLPQIAAPPAVDEARALAGLWRIALGLAKKLWLADTLALTLTDRVFAHPEQFSALENLLGVYGYAFQIYLDFSAYSDIAVGAAALLGFALPENFRAPYRSGDLAAFWRRWHISLSSWLRDYLYIPLGGSRDGEARTYRNLALTMLLGGLWHGAAWTFVVWGLLHGGGLAVTRAVQRPARPARRARHSAAPRRRVAAPRARVALARAALGRRRRLRAAVRVAPRRRARDLPLRRLRLDLLPRPALRRRPRGARSARDAHPRRRQRPPRLCRRAARRRAHAPRARAAAVGAARRLRARAVVAAGGAARRGGSRVAGARAAVGSAFHLLPVLTGQCAGSGRAVGGAGRYSRTAAFWSVRSTKPASRSRSSPGSTSLRVDGTYSPPRKTWTARRPLFDVQTSRTPSGA